MCLFLGSSTRITTAETVHIPDSNLRAFLEVALGKKTGEDITQTDMASLKVLHASRCRFLTLAEIGEWGTPVRWICQPLDGTFGYSVRDLTGLEFATNLTELHLGRNRLLDVSPLKGLTNLTFLDLGFNLQLSDISPLENLTNLTFLNLKDNRISDVSPLKNMTKLIELDLRGNEISDVTSLKNLVSLIYLDLQDNQISDIFALENLTNLTHLKLKDNRLSDVSALKT